MNLNQEYGFTTPNDKPSNKGYSLLPSIWSPEPFNGPASGYVRLVLGPSKPKPSIHERYRLALFGTNTLENNTLGAKKNENLSVAKLLGQNQPADESADTRYSGSLITSWDPAKELRNAERELAYFDLSRSFTLCDPSPRDAARDAISRYERRMAQIDRVEEKYMTSFEQACKAGLVRVSDVQDKVISLSEPFWKARAKAQEELDATVSKDVQIDLAVRKILEKKKKGDITSFF